MTEDIKRNDVLYAQSDELLDMLDDEKQDTPTTQATQAMDDDVLLGSMEPEADDNMNDDTFLDAMEPEAADSLDNDAPDWQESRSAKVQAEEVPEYAASQYQDSQEKRQPATIRPVVLIAAAVGVLLIVVLLFLLFSGSLGGTRLTARTLTDVNLRQGPGIGYQAVGALSPGTRVNVVGRNEDGSWLLVKTEDGDQVWMTGLAGYVEIDQAKLDKLPVIASSGNTYDTSNPAVSKVLNNIPLAVYHADHYTCASHAGLNNMLPEVAEGNVIGPHAGDFAYAAKEGNVLFKYTGGTFVLIRDNPIARFEGDVESLPLNQALQMFEDGEVVWTGEPGRWPARGVPGCDLEARPD